MTVVCQGLLWSLGTRLTQPDPPLAKTSRPQTAVPVLLGRPEKEKNESERELAKVICQVSPPYMRMPEAPVSSLHSAARVLCSALHGRRIWTNEKGGRWEIRRVGGLEHPDGEWLGGPESRPR